MTIRVAAKGGATTLFLSGEIDLESSPELRRALLEQLADGKSVLVDLADVRYMDSSGLASLVEAYQRAKDKSLDFALVRVSEPVLKVLKLARLDRVFSIRA
jgi:anti-sigma B factor antagonist